MMGGYRSDRNEPSLSRETVSGRVARENKDAHVRQLSFAPYPKHVWQQWVGVCQGRKLRSYWKLCERLIIETQNDILAGP